jgi:hypothetical protein
VNIIKISVLSKKDLGGSERERERKIFRDRLRKRDFEREERDIEGLTYW